MKLTTLVLAGSLAAFIAGCAETPPVGESQQPAIGPEAKVPPPAVPDMPVRPVVSESDALLGYFDQVRKLSAADFAREVEFVRRSYAKARTDVVRLRYAMLLAATPAAPADEARAAELLEPVLKSADTNLRSLAFLLNAQLQEQRRVQALQQKLDALLSLDKTLIERGTKTP